MPDWWIGRKHSEETKAKMRLARRGANNSFFGKRHSTETKHKISKSRSGKCVGSINPMFGKTHTEETRLKIALVRIERGHARGAKNPLWKGGVHKLVRQSKRSLGIEARLKKWKEKVLQKAGNTCERCGRKDRLHVHHRKSWYSHEKLRFLVSNGECLCHSCHSKETVKETKRWQKKVGGVLTSMEL